MHTDTSRFAKRARPHTELHVGIFSKTYILICENQVADDLCLGLANEKRSEVCSVPNRSNHLFGLVSFENST